MQAGSAGDVQLVLSPAIRSEPRAWASKSIALCQCHTAGLVSHICPPRHPDPLPAARLCHAGCFKTSGQNVSLLPISECHCWECGSLCEMRSLKLGTASGYPEVMADYLVPHQCSHLHAWHQTIIEFRVHYNNDVTEGQIHSSQSSSLCEVSLT